MHILSKGKKETEEIINKYSLDHPEAKLKYDEMSKQETDKSGEKGPMICKHRRYGCICGINKNTITVNNHNKTDVRNLKLITSIIFVVYELINDRFNNKLLQRDRLTDCF